MIYQFEACDKKNKKPKVSQSKETKKTYTFMDHRFGSKKKIKLETKNFIFDFQM